MSILNYKRTYDLHTSVMFVNISGETTVSGMKSIIGKELGVKAWYLDIVQHCNIQNNDSIISLDTTVEVIVHPEDRDVPLHLQSRLPDCLTGDTDEPTVKLSCFHAISADNLYSSCLSQLNDRKTAFYCPKCNHELPFVEVIQKACLTSDEKSFFEQRINLNLSEAGKSCPTCLSFCDRLDHNNPRVACTHCRNAGKPAFEFCWDCGHSWRANHICRNIRDEMQSQLQNCERITMGYNNMENVPKIRACPSCNNMIEHNGGCKTMTCKYCNQTFCFCCLRLAEKGRLPCGDHMVVCKVAPIQIV